MCKYMNKDQLPTTHNIMPVSFTHAKTEYVEIYLLLLILLPFEPPRAWYICLHLSKASLCECVFLQLRACGFDYWLLCPGGATDWNSRLRPGRALFIISSGNYFTHDC